MTDPGHDASLWTDRSFLRDVQYKTDVNLAARQSIYAYQEPPMVEAVADRLQAAPGAVFRVTTHSGCLISA